MFKQKPQTPEFIRLNNVTRIFRTLLRFYNFEFLICNQSGGSVIPHYNIKKSKHAHVVYIFIWDSLQVSMYLFLSTCDQWNWVSVKFILLFPKHVSFISCARVGWDENYACFWGCLEAGLSVLFSILHRIEKLVEQNFYLNIYLSIIFILNLDLAVSIRSEISILGTIGTI